MFWFPLLAPLLRPGPETETEDALLVFHEIVVDAGSVPAEGLAAIEPETLASDVTVTVTVCVAGPFGPCAVMV